jgi:hypothetical protein
MRYPDPMCDEDQLTLKYIAAVSKFFAYEIKIVKASWTEFEEAPQDVKELLACRFYDVSYLANKYPPVAVPVTAEACNLGRRLLQAMGWFKPNRSRAKNV